ncbi:MAG: hypothetical protein ACRYGG_01040 [Janthinobacterium lividum]
MIDFVKVQLDNIERNYLAGMITERQRDEAIDDVIRNANRKGR